jgi:hypothetical protein
VPVRLAGRRVRSVWALRMSRCSTRDQPVVARHPRSLHKNTETLSLDHYLEVLVRKPGALPGATALAQAKTAGVFTDQHQRLLGRGTPLPRGRGRDPAADRGPAATPPLPADAVLAALTAANTNGIIDPAVVAVEARRHADARPLAEVVPIGALAIYDRPAPSVAAYDQLLTGEAHDHG